ncbi:MAG: FtsX-like permease family protein [Candidatus Methylomirabilales bacterium]
MDRRVIRKTWGFFLLFGRGLTQFPLRVVLTACGIAIGVAAFVAIQLANHSILASFHRTINAVAGRSALVVTAGELGFDETLLLKVRAVEGVKFAAPLITSIAPVAGRPGEVLLVLGADLLAEGAFREYHLTGQQQAVHLTTLLQPETLFLSRSFAAAHGLAVGDRITLLTGSHRRVFTIQGLLKARGAARALEGHLALMDIATAQAAFDKVGRLDRIDLVLRDGVGVDATAARLEQVLPSHLTVTRPGQRNHQVETMLAAFRLNLNALSAIALVVAAFLIYSTVSLAVIHRRPQIGILRSLGLQAGEVVALFLGEAVVVGGIGSLMGLALGTVLARYVLETISQTVSNLYSFVRVTRVDADPVTLLVALGLGLSFSLLAALYPSLQGGRIPVREALNPALAGEEERGSGALFLLGLLLLAGAYWASRQAAVGSTPVFGYLALVLLILGGALLTPGAILGCAWMIRRLGSSMGRGDGLLVASHLRGYRGRHAVAVAAMMTALAMLIGVAIMIGSFRRTVEIWVQETIRADLIVAPASRFTKGVHAVLPRELLDRVRTIPGIAAVDPFTGLKIPFRGRELLLATRDFAVAAARGRLLFVAGDSKEILPRAKDRQGIIISETVALAHGIQEGDQVVLKTPNGPAAFPVAGVFYDYTTDGGKIVMDRSLFRRYWGEPGINVLAVYLTPGGDPAAVARRIKRAGEGAAILVMRNQDLKKRILAIFDQTFAVTDALRIIAVLVAALGILNALWASVLERQREIGILRSVGAPPAQVLRVILQEAGLLGLLAEILGLVIGLFLALVLIHVINKQSFGWSLLFAFPPSILVTSAGLVVVTSLLAGLLPALYASRIDVVEAIRYE